MKLSVRRKIAVRKYWTCPTCNGAVSTSFCPDCGEHPLRAHDLTLRGFLGQMVQTCTNIDGPFLRSLRCLVSRPGVLTYAFLLLLLCVSLTVLGISLAFGGPGLESEDFDHALSIVELVLCATYLHLAVRTVYSAQGMSRILKVGALAFAVAGIFLGYRFALLLITLSAT